MGSSAASLVVETAGQQDWLRRIASPHEIDGDDDSSSRHMVFQHKQGSALARHLFSLSNLQWALHTDGLTELNLKRPLCERACSISHALFWQGHCSYPIGCPYRCMGHLGGAPLKSHWESLLSEALWQHRGRDIYWWLTVTTQTYWLND